MSFPFELVMRAVDTILSIHNYTLRTHTHTHTHTCTLDRKSSCNETAALQTGRNDWCTHRWAAGKDVSEVSYDESLTEKQEDIASQCLYNCVPRYSIILRDGFLAEPGRCLVWSTGTLVPLFTFTLSILACCCLLALNSSKYLTRSFPSTLNIH